MLLFTVFLWLSAMIFGSKPIFAANLRCYKGTLDDYDETPLENASLLLKSSCFNSNYYTRFYVFGYEVKANGTDATTVISALLTLPESNVLLLNWEKEASGDETNSVTEVLSYPKVVLFEVSSVGTEFGNALVSMARAGLNLNITQLIGHSLGAHVCGNAGRILIANGLTVDRITGLDPAGPFFTEPLSIMVPLDKSCASYVDCVHTDYGVYGINSSLCNTDTYLIKLKENVQPGCPVGLFVPLSRDSTCSHNRCWKVYSDSILHPHTLIAGQADTFADWFGCRGNYDNTLSVGIHVDRSQNGNFFISPTHRDPPYGRGPAGRKPSQCLDDLCGAVG